MCSLSQVVAELKKRAEEIAQTLTMEAGKPIKDARGEVSRTIDTFQVAAEESVRIYGEHMPLDISARNKGLQVLIRCSRFDMIESFNAKTLFIFFKTFRDYPISSL